MSATYSRSNDLKLGPSIQRLSEFYDPRFQHRKVMTVGEILEWEENSIAWKHVISAYRDQRDEIARLRTESRDYLKLLLTPTPKLFCRKRLQPIARLIVKRHWFIEIK